MNVFGIETSCDETSCAVVRDGKWVLSNVTASSLRLHKKYNGIIPEIASRAHIEYISFVADNALKSASKTIKDIDLVCVTKEPGLIGSLLVGIAFAKALSFAAKKPLIEANHLQAHLYASFLVKGGVWVKEKKEGLPKLPFIGLVISGGHTSLYRVDKGFSFKLLGSTCDDAVGEAYDKVARILGAGYPGGPLIEKMAVRGSPSRVRFSCNGPGGLDFSFSGIKTAVLYKWQNQPENIKSADIASSFQEAVADILIRKSIFACKRNAINTLVIGGGVAANNYLRGHFINQAAQERIKVYFPDRELSLDNAAMIAGLGYQLYRNKFHKP